MKFSKTFFLGTFGPQGLTNFWLVIVKLDALNGTEQEISERKQMIPCFKRRWYNVTLLLQNVMVVTDYHTITSYDVYPLNQVKGPGFYVHKSDL